MDSSIVLFVISYLCLLLALSVHEAAHAAMAFYRGDDTAKHLGRITLNPLKHIDPIGTVLMPILMFATGIPFLFGWAKPVPFNPRRLKDMKLDPVLIAIAGPISNLLLAVFFAFIARIIFLVQGVEGTTPFLAIFFIMIVQLNLVLFFFNFIPVPPLDGHYVLSYFLPPSGQAFLRQIGPFGIIIAMFASRPLFDAVSPIIDGFLEFMIGV